MKGNECECLNRIADAQAALGRREHARQTYGAATNLARELDLRHQLALAMAGLARLDGDRGRMAEAAAILETMSAADAARVRKWLGGPST